ncbi:Ig-like domain-containing protein [Kitasatospora sp. LaBMicrA B282]|uniref:L,D-transpeptidase n=1 Tax=Kitasatospora sp. LaBMicrA B282 TaxID=3420949 RepID=UPI003D0F731E
MQSIHIRATGRRATATALLLGGVLLLSTACTSGGGTHPGGSDAKGGGPSAAGGSPSSSAAPKTSAAVVDVEPKNGAQNVAPSGALKVSVTSGKLTQVAVTGPDGKPVAGTVATDGLTWAPSGALAVGAAYQVNAQAVDANGVATSTTSDFTTLKPTKTARTIDNIQTGETYGVGMIIRVDFQQKVVDKQAAQQAITVEASDGTQVKGHWLNDDNWLDLRPETYWKPGTKVTIHYRTSNVQISPGVYGNSDRDESFTIGRSKISTVDAATHMMNVVEDGKAPKDIAITAGAPDNPSWNGTMVVFEKDRTEVMDSSTTTIKGAGYKTTEPHALKITDTGSYVHGNPKANEWAGKANISHGCIGLPDSEAGDDNSVAGQFYADSIIGDVVIVNHSTGGQVAADNGLGGWNVPWAQW